MFKAWTFRTGTTENKTTHRFSLCCRLHDVTTDGFSAQSKPDLQPEFLKVSSGENRSKKHLLS